MNTIRIKRIYDSPAHTDGYRVLVDRLWPRGISKADAGIDGWAKSIAPSTELRKSFAHQAELFDGFQTAYRGELDGNPDAVEFARTCREQLLSRNVTLLYAAKDETCNNASVLCGWIQQKIHEGSK